MGSDRRELGSGQGGTRGGIVLLVCRHREDQNPFLRPRRQLLFRSTFTEPPIEQHAMCAVQAAFGEEPRRREA